MNTIIEKIRAEVERLKNDRAFFDDNQQLAYWEGLNKVSEKLSDLEKECEKPTNIDFEQELYKHFGQVKDFTLGMQIGKYFYELGCRRTAEKYDEIEYKRQRAEESVPSDLEEAAAEYASDSTGFIDMTAYRAFIAGAKWQKEQIMKEAVDGKVFMSFAPGCNQRVVSTQDVDLPCETKVKLIVVKED